MMEFETEWARFHGKVPPLAFMMRGADRKPWIRFHALPGSVRYAKTKIERGEIRRRATILANETLGRHADCWLVQCRIEEYSKPHWKPLEASSASWLRYRGYGEDIHWMASATPVVWHEEAFNDLLDDIAEDRTGPTLWCNRKNGSVFAPYDGGFDLFPASLAECAKLRTLHEDWLSEEPSGL